VRAQVPDRTKIRGGVVPWREKGNRMALSFLLLRGGESVRESVREREREREREIERDKRIDR
jgi:hypothetical protein